MTDSDTPGLRLFALLEAVARHDGLVSLHGLTAQTGMPKPTVHRMLQQLEAARLVVRHADGRHYEIGQRLRAFAETLLLNDTQHGARHAVLRELVAEVGEACNITALSGDEVVYLDRVETSEPLRFHLHPGSRVPIHCSASGKMLLSQLRAAPRRLLLAQTRLAALTPKTVTDPEELERQARAARRDGYALDEEEFLPGLFCVAVPVPSAGGPSNQCVALQAPLLRVGRDQVDKFLPALQDAAARIGAIGVAADERSRGEGGRGRTDPRYQGGAP